MRNFVKAATAFVASMAPAGFKPTSTLGQAGFNTTSHSPPDQEHPSPQASATDGSGDVQHESGPQASPAPAAHEPRSKPHPLLQTSTAHRSGDEPRQSNSQVSPALVVPHSPSQPYPLPQVSACHGSGNLPLQSGTQASSTQPRAEGTILRPISGLRERAAPPGSSSVRRAASCARRDQSDRSAVFISNPSASA